MAAVLLVALALAPWLALAPLPGLGAVGAHVLVLGAALHGAGLALARLAGWRAIHPLLAIQWGLATLIGLLGIAIAAGAGGLATQAVLVYGFAAVHTAALAIGLPAYRARLAATRPTLRLWIVPAALLAAIGALHVLGSAGDLGARPFDDDGHVLAQLQRLRDSGTLGDPIGYARHAQLGGQLAFGALATLGGDVHLVRLAEALALVLAVGLALARLRPPGETDASSGLWAVLLVIAAAAFTYTRPDPATCWTAVGLILALHATLEDLTEEASALPIGVVAGALIALRFELAPLAAVALAAAWWRRRGSARATLVLALGALAVVVPYAAARVLAWGSVPPAARALVEPWRSPLGAQLAISAGVAAACAPLIVLGWRGSLRWLAIGAALTIGGIVGQLTGERPYAASFLWPLAIAAGLVLAVELARNRKVTTAALLVSLFAAVFIYEGRATSGRQRWTRRYLSFAESVEYLRSARATAPVGGGYAPLLRGVPAGAVVAVWVTRPERLDYGAPYRILDLRTPRAAWMRPIGPYPRGALQRLLAHAGADFLLVEADDRSLARTRYRALCAEAPLWCTDDLEALALTRPALAEAGGVRLLDLRPPPPPPLPPAP